MALFTRFTDTAKYAIFCASKEASIRKSEFITPTDILLGLTWAKHAEDCRFRILKEKEPELRILLEVPGIPSDLLLSKPDRNRPLSRDAKKLLANARGEAKKDRQFWIDDDHLHRALLKGSTSESSALGSIGFTYDLVRQWGLEGRLRYPPKRVSLSIWLRAHPWWRLFAYVCVGLLIGMSLRRIA